MRAYEASLDIESENMIDQLGEGQDYLGGEKGKRVAELALAAVHG